MVVRRSIIVRLWSFVSIRWLLAKNDVELILYDGSQRFLLAVDAKNKGSRVGSMNL
jgi:hypothetical protein